MAELAPMTSPDGQQERVPTSVAEQVRLKYQGWRPKTSGSRSSRAAKKTSSGSSGTSSESK